MLQILRELARYNRWMNKTLFGRLGDMPDPQRKEDAGLFFHSIHGTLNHLLLTDRLWLARLTGETYDITGLDQEIYADFAQLRLQRKLTDRQLVEHVDALDQDALELPLEFTSTTTGETRSFPRQRALVHLFNHQTHHRGQITAAISRRGLDYGVTDLIFMPAEERE